MRAPPTSSMSVSGSGSMLAGPSTPFDLAQDRCLLGGFAVASVEEDAGSGEAVVLGGVVFALCDFVQEVQDVARVVGPRADLLGESLRRGRWCLLGCCGHWFLAISG